MRFAVLASGSSGNAAYVEANDFGLLIDIGLGPRQLEDRLVQLGIGWAQVRAVLLTHTHTDHWNDRSFNHLFQREIPLYCHLKHQRVLMKDSPAFADLCASHLVMAYEPGEVFHLTPRFSCLPFSVHHDSGLTVGFRLEGPSDFFGEPAALGYASDLGTWDQELARTLADVDALAVEFNHDIHLQKNSPRSRRLIARNLGNKGHLSNEQAAALIKEVLRLSRPQRLRHIVQLHLSQQCNTPELALGALEKILQTYMEKPQVHTAAQSTPGPDLMLGHVARPRSSRKGKRDSRQSSAAEREYIHLHLPGCEE